MKVYKSEPGKLEQFCSCALAVTGALLMLGLSVFSLFYTYIFEENHKSIPQIMHDRPLPALIFIAVMTAVLFCLGKLILKDEAHRKRNIRILLGCVCVYAFVYGLAWAFFCKYYMTWDQKLVSFFGEQFALGIDDMSASDLDYIGAYSHQIGLISVLEIIYRICGSENYHAFQALNALAAAGIVFVGYKMVCQLSSKEEPGVYFLLLMLGCHPLYIYATYMYGEVLSVLFSMAAVYGLLKYLETEQRFYWILMAVSITLGCLIRNNCYIVLAAMGCVLAVKAIDGRKIRYMGVLLICILSFFAARAALIRVYEPRIQVSLREPMPSILWVAMGLQEVEGGAGWHDESFYQMFVDKSDSREQAEQFGKAAVEAELKGFAENPAYAVDFMKRKVLSQWIEPTYACQQETNPRIEERGPLADRLYKGDLKAPFTRCMDLYQSLIYVGAFLYLFFPIRRKVPLEKMTLFVAILGGFLFYLLWEAKSRYIFPYFMMMLPMAACGYDSLMTVLKLDKAGSMLQGFWDKRRKE